MLNRQEVTDLLLENLDTFYAYELYRPDKEYVFYVGKGCNGRIFNHEHRLHTENNNPYKNNIIKKLLRNGLDLQYNIFLCNTETEAFLTEISLIREHGRKDLKLGLLCNLTDGGEGSSNPSKEIRHKMSQSLLKYYSDPEHIKQNSDAQKKSYRENPRRGIDHSLMMELRYMQNPEIAKQHSESMKQIYIDRPELREQKSKDNIKRYEDPKEREKISLAGKKRFEDPKEREKQSISGKKRFKDPLERKKISIKGKQHYQEYPERAKKHSACMKEYYKDPKNREKTGLASKKVYQDHHEIAKNTSERNNKRHAIVKPIRERCKAFIEDNNIDIQHDNGKLIVGDFSIHFLSGLPKWLEFEKHLLTLI